MDDSTPTGAPPPDLAAIEAEIRQLREQDIPALNKLIRDKAVDAISVPKPAPPVAPSSI